MIERGVNAGSGSIGRLRVLALRGFLLCCEKKMLKIGSVIILLLVYGSYHVL